MTYLAGFAIGCFYGLIIGGIVGVAWGLWRVRVEDVRLDDWYVDWFEVDINRLEVRR